MATVELPTYPSRGSRRALDQGWLELLRREGLPAFLASVPEPPEELSQAITEFNKGQYWQCHETLEQVWLPEHYPLRLFYQGLIKAAVGLLHLERHNRRGATLKLGDAEYTLAPFLPRFMDVATGELCRDVMQRLVYLRAEGPVDWNAIDRLPPVRVPYPG